MTSGAWSNSIPGIGTYFVGIDVAPGRYRCEDGKGGWWVRFTGPGGGDPVGSWPLPAGPTEIEIAPTDFAFETHVGTYWHRIAPADADDPISGARELRPVADPGLRAELDTIVARRRPLVWLAPLTVLGIGVLGAPLLGSLWLLGMAMMAVLVALGSPTVSLDLQRARELSRRRDRYLTPQDFDDEGRALLARVQAAVDTVRDSRVNREGLLDTVDNAVTLPRQEWEIAQVLARQSGLRAEQRAASSPALPEVEAALRPFREKLALSVRAVTRRVEALERYAERVRAADEALEAHRRLEALSARAQEYDDLLADTVRDELALPAIERLTEQGDALVQSLRDRLAEAAEAGDEAGAELPPPPGTPPPSGD
ncbi:hypothetical protein ACQP1W_12375 [Spirillospora sp. CA-255316]